MTAAAHIQRTPPQPSQRLYAPRGGALALFYCKDAEVVVEGPAGTGKSRACLEKIHLCLMKYPGARALACRKTRRSMTESVLVTYEEKVLPERSPIKAGPKRNMRQAYLYPNGSTLVIGGLDDADKIMSTEYDMIYVPEATEATEDDAEKLTTRLRNGVMPYQQLIMDCNPASPTHWLNQRANAGRTTRILSRHEDNPSVTESYLATLRNLTGARRARLYEGRWAAQEGLVYDFDPARHVVDRLPDGWHLWRKIRVIDFGYTNPFVCQWWAIDGDGRMYLYRELYMAQRTVQQHAAVITVLSGGETYEATVADHDAEDRATLEQAKIRTIPAFKAIAPGIQAVQERLKKAGDGQARLFLLRDALVSVDVRLQEAKKPYSTQQEFDGYVWPIGREGKNESEAPVKEDDHGMDALRYAVAYVDKLGTTFRPIKQRSYTGREL